MKMLKRVLFSTVALSFFGFSFGQDLPSEIILKDLKIGPLGYKILSTDFDADPDRQIVVTLAAAGQIIDIRGRFISGKNIEEWSVYYKEGTPALAQLRKWRKTSIDGEELGEALVMIETLIAKGGNFTPKKEVFAARLKELQDFAKSKQSNKSE